MKGRFRAHHPKSHTAKNIDLIDETFQVIEFDADAMPVDHGRRVFNSDRFVHPCINRVVGTRRGRLKSNPVLSSIGRRKVPGLFDPRQFIRYGEINPGVTSDIAVKRFNFSLGWYFVARGLGFEMQQEM